MQGKFVLSFSRGIKDLTSFSFINEGKAFNISILRPMPNISK
jgi:hypothetical protein